MNPFSFPPRGKNPSTYVFLDTNGYIIFRGGITTETGFGLQNVFVEAAKQVINHSHL